MTLIVGYASPEYAILASDRMVTWRLTLGSEVREKYRERTTKATFLDGRYIIGYSGVADLGGDTELWLLERLSDALVKNPLGVHWQHALVEAARSALLSKNLDPRSAWLSFMAVGYEPVHGAAGETLIPSLGVIANSKSQGFGKTFVSDPQDFWGSPNLSIGKVGTDSHFWAVGNCPDVEKMNDAAVAIRNYRKKNPDKCLGIADIMAVVIGRRSKELKGRGVGNRVQVTVFPRAAYGFGTVSTPLAPVTDPIRETTVLQYGDWSGVVLEEVLHYGTNIVGSDGSIFHGTVVQLGGTEFIDPPTPFVPPGWDDPQWA